MLNRIGLIVMIFVITLSLSSGLFFGSSGGFGAKNSNSESSSGIPATLEISDLEELETQISSVKINNDILELGLENPVKKKESENSSKLNLYDEAFFNGFFACTDPGYFISEMT